MKRIIKGVSVDAGLIMGGDGSYDVKLIFHERK
jgi:hypothetical protein